MSDAAAVQSEGSRRTEALIPLETPAASAVGGSFFCPEAAVPGITPPEFTFPNVIALAPAL